MRWLCALAIMLASCVVTAAPQAEPVSVPASPTTVEPVRSTSNSQDTATVTFLRASTGYGSGSAAVIQGPDFTLVIDSGYPRGSGERDMTAIVDGPIDLLVGTHPHVDHIGQHADLIRTGRVKEVWMSGTRPHATRDAHLHVDAYEETMAALLSHSATYREPRAGETHRIGSLTIEVLYPFDVVREPDSRSTLNNLSIVLRMTYRDISMLFTGDALHEAEQDILQARFDVSAHLLELGHHGVGDASSAAWLEAVDPEVSVYSAHLPHVPADEVVTNVTRFGSTLFGTGVHGAVTITTDGHVLDVVTGHDRLGITSLSDWHELRDEVYEP